MSKQYQSSLFKKIEVKASETKMPSKFTYPFSYTPHPLCKIASKEIQNYLEIQKDFTHDFGLGTNSDATGKMFGVLVVENAQKELGYIAAFSGKLANQYHLEGFAPPVYDLDVDGAFFKRGMATVTNLSIQIKELESDKKFCRLLETIEREHQKAKEELALLKSKMEQEKAERKDNLRFERLTLSTNEYDQLCVAYSIANTADKLEFEQLEDAYQIKIDQLDGELDPLLDAIDELKNLRDRKLLGIQQELYSQFKFLNSQGEQQNLQDLFKKTQTPNPPDGAGECAVPKLLQYAFLNDLKPISMAQFWWGASPKTTIRHHQEYYPSCMGKCLPILSFMLTGIAIDENPYHQNLGANHEVEIIFEDASLAVINKPINVLSVPGRIIEDSVYTRMVKVFPNATGPLIVHRLDQSTSGIMLIAKTKKAHKRLQKQFIERTIHKAYIAVLDGTVASNESEGLVDLPLCLDYTHRPCQQVNFEMGKPAQTKWKILEQSNEKTRIIFSPITGRTHQLRVHAAHQLGLNTPILGDDLYGHKGNRLHLHASGITFTHPITKKKMSFRSEPDF